MRKALVAVVVAIVATGCGWPQFRGGAAHTGLQPIESKIGPGTVAWLHEVWTAELPAFSSSPVVTGGRV